MGIVTPAKAGVQNLQCVDFGSTAEMTGIVIPHVVMRGPLSFKV